MIESDEKRKPNVQHWIFVIITLYTSVCLQSHCYFIRLVYMSLSNLIYIFIFLFVFPFDKSLCSFSHWTPMNSCANTNRRLFLLTSSSSSLLVLSLFTQLKHLSIWLAFETIACRERVTSFELRHDFINIHGDSTYIFSLVV